MLNYIQLISRPDIIMDLHQVTRFTHNPQLSHECALLKIACYLSHTQHQGEIYTPNLQHGIDFYVDADFSGGW